MTDTGRDTYLEGVDPKQAFRLDAHPLTMFHLLDDQFGDVEDGWLWWDPDTIWHEIQAVYGVEPSIAARETINALKACLVTKAPWNDAWIFSNVVVALSGGVSDLERVQYPTVGQLLFALDIMQRIDEQEPFDESVVLFQAACCHAHGVVYADGPLQEADKVLAEWDLMASDRPTAPCRAAATSPSTTTTPAMSQPLSCGRLTSGWTS